MLNTGVREDISTEAEAQPKRANVRHVRHTYILYVRKSQHPNHSGQMFNKSFVLRPKIFGELNNLLPCLVCTGVVFHIYIIYLFRTPLAFTVSGMI